MFSSHTTHHPSRSAVSHIPRFQAASTKPCDTTPEAPALNTKLLQASRDGNLALLKQCLDAGANPNTIDINQNDKTALMIATTNGHLPIVEELLKQKTIDIEAKNIDGRTALLLAASTGQLNVMAKLLEAGAKVNESDNEGYTALILATLNGHHQVVTLLLDKKANINAETKIGRTAYDIALNHNRLYIAEQLIEHGIPVNTTNHNGTTAVMLTTTRMAKYTRAERLAALERLLQKGADVNLTDSAGSTVLTEAIGKGMDAITKRLLEYPSIEILFGLDKETFKALLGMAPLTHTRKQEIIEALLGAVYITDWSQKEWLSLMAILKRFEAQALEERRLEELSFLQKTFDDFPQQISFSTLNQWLLSTIPKTVARLNPFKKPLKIDPFEAEYLFLINHPHIENAGYEHFLGQLIRTLASRYHFPHNNMLSGALAKLWGNFGFHSHDFITQKYDTRGGPNSLLCQQDFNGKKFEFIPKDKKWPFGHQFILETETQRILFCHGFKAVSDDTHGTLIIRNSSPVFGRDQLKQVTYFSPTPLSKTALLALNPDRDPQFKSALDGTWYQNETMMEESFERLSALNQVFFGIRNKLFDSRNLNHFITDPKTGEHVWAAPEGFKQILDYLTHCMIKEEPLPSLVLLNPHYPAHQPLFTLPLTEDRVELMVNAISCNAHHLWNEDPELYEFIKNAIQRYNLALTLVDPQPIPLFI